MVDSAKGAAADVYGHVGDALSGDNPTMATMVGEASRWQVDPSELQAAAQALDGLAPNAEATATEAWAEEYAALWRDRPVYGMREPADFLDLFGDLPPYRAPGEQFQYSNAGYIVLGLVIEEVAGTGYIEAVDARVFAPAGMRDSGFFAADDVRPDVAAGYMRPSRAGEPWRTNVFTVPIVGGADGGAFATAADLDRFLSLYAAGELVTPPLLEEALRPHGQIGDGEAMGLGVYLIGDGPDRAIGSEGGDPGAEAIIRHYPELGRNTLVLSNVNGSAWPIGKLLHDTVTAPR